MTEYRTARTFSAAAVVLFAVMLGPVALMFAGVPTGDVVRAFAQSEIRDALGVSLAASTIATLAATLLGVPAGYALARARSSVRNAALFALALPLAFPPVASGVMLLHAFGSHGIVGSLLAAHGAGVVDSLAGVALAEFFVSGSFVAISACAAFAAVPARYIEAARVMGASDALVFARIAVPLAAPGIVAGILLAWLRAIGEYGATSVVAYHPSSLPVALYVTLSAQGVAAALAVAYGFVALAIAIFAAQWAVRRRVV